MFFWFLFCYLFGHKKKTAEVWQVKSNVKLTKKVDWIDSFRQRMNATSCNMFSKKHQKALYAIKEFGASSYLVGIVLLISIVVKCVAEFGTFFFLSFFWFSNHLRWFLFHFCDTKHKYDYTYINKRVAIPAMADVWGFDFMQT